MDYDMSFKLYKQIRDLIADISFMILRFRKQNYFDALRKGNQVLRYLSETMEQIFHNITWLNEDRELVNSNKLMSDMDALLKAQEDNDYILLADLYELSFLPFLINIQEYMLIKHGFICDDKKYERTISLLMQKEDFYTEIIKLLQGIDVVDAITESGFYIEPTITGALTLASKREDKRYYFHSNSNVYTEAEYLSYQWYEEEIEEYVVYGLGLGYHIRALLEICAYANIRVYESNINVIRAAAAFGILEELLENPSFMLYYDHDFKKLNNYIVSMKEISLLLIHHPSLYAINNDAEREALDEYFIQYNSVKSQKKYLDANFKKNITLYDAPADSLSHEFMGKDIYIVAAGPSLDLNIHELNKIKESSLLRSKSLILAVGTVYSKLLKAGIIPDYIVVSDAKPNTYVQFLGLEDGMVPLIGLSTLYYKFFNNYAGKKYIAFQKGYKKSEKFAKEHDLILFDTGGSVSTVALDIAISLSAGRIIFVGLDLAYTGGVMHASETSKNHTIEDKDNVIYIDDICGNKIATGKNLNIYRKWIEKRITSSYFAEIIDATEGGAYIKGSKKMKLLEVIKQAMDNL